MSTDIRDMLKMGRVATGGVATGGVGGVATSGVATRGIATGDVAIDVQDDDDSSEHKIGGEGHEHKVASDAKDKIDADADAEADAEADANANAEADTVPNYFEYSERIAARLSEHMSLVRAKIVKEFNRLVRLDKLKPDDLVTTIVVQEGYNTHNRKFDRDGCCLCAACRFRGDTAGLNAYNDNASIVPKRMLARMRNIVNELNDSEEYHPFYLYMGDLHQVESGGDYMVDVTVKLL